MNFQRPNTERERGLVLWASPRPREVCARIAIAGDFLPAGKLHLAANGDWREMARPLASNLEDVSATFINLESVLDSSDLPPRPLCGLGDIVSAPSNSLDYLQALHTNIVSLANNHSYDFASEGVARTTRAIASRGMVPLGAGRDICSDPEVFVWQGPHRICVGFWAAARATVDPATRDTAGVEPATAARALRALHLMRRDGATFCVALLHAGVLRTCYPAPEDVQLIDRLAALGFNVVAASHSHRISGAKYLRGEGKRDAFCFYGLGSLVSGYIAHPAEREGLIVVAALDSEGALVQLEVRPVFLAESGFGEIPSQAAGRSILDRFLRISSEIETGAYERAFYRDVSKGLLRLYLRDARRAFQQLGIRGLARKASRVRVQHVKRLVHKVTG